MIFVYVIMIIWAACSAVTAYLFVRDEIEDRRARRAVRDRHPSRMAKFRPTACSACGRRFGEDATVHDLAEHVRTYHRRTALGPEDRADWK